MIIYTVLMAVRILNLPVHWIWY